jgi:hypothetical protein
MPNTFAYVVFFFWPLVVIVLFLRLPVAAALACSVIGGYLLIPIRTGYNFPMIPTIDKDALPSLIAGLMILLVAGRQADVERRDRRQAVEGAETGRRRPAPDMPVTERVIFRRTLGSTIMLVLLLMACASSFLTVLANREPVVVGGIFLPGLRLYDAASVLGRLLITLLPFLLARRYLATPESHVVLLKVFCIAALGYSLLALYEIRMSPQLNTKIYGFFAGGSFRQQVRGLGYRPVVFLQHGLWLGIFLAMAVLGAAALWCQTRQQRLPTAWRWGAATLWLLAVLVLSNSLGALIIGLLFLPVVLFMGVRGQLLFAAIIAGSILAYPMLRGAGLVPVQTLLNLSGAISESRAASLGYRFRNEDILLAHANEKPLAGWGGYGRNRVRDLETGQDISTTDGMWIITIGTWGWVGYISQFGLLILPTIFLAARRRELEISYATAGLALMLAANLLDMIPNATLTPLTWLIGGALAGRYAVAPASKPAKQPQRTVRGTRHREPVRASEQAPSSLPRPQRGRARLSRSKPADDTRSRPRPT